MLKPIAFNSAHGPAWTPKITATTYSIGTHDGSPAGSDFRDWSFATPAVGYRATYFEIWNKSQDGRREFWYLYRAYLHILKLEMGDLKEFLLLHCDPNDTPDTSKKPSIDKLKKLERISFYKQHPHLHVVTAPAPFTHAHIALCVGFKDEILKSIDTLSEAFNHAILMIREEVLDEIIKN